MSARSAKAKTRVIAIVGQSHSGSHLLSQLLGAHSRCVAIGELHNYDKFVHRSSGGNVTADYAHNELFAGLDTVSVDHWHTQVLANARSQDPAVTTLIDNSKRVRWCRRLLKNPLLEVIPVHLIRDPRAMIRYWMLRYDDARKLRRQRLRLTRTAPLQMGTLLRCTAEELYLRKWLIDNRRATRLLAQSKCTANVVTYHDLATRPAETLETLMPRLGLDFEPAQLRYGEVAQHGTRKRDYLAASETSQIQLDVRWQTFLSAAQVRTIADDPRVAGYLSRLNLTLTPQGLTARR